MLRLMKSMLAILVATPLHAGVCVSNGTDASYVFTAEVDGGMRVVETVDPGGTLCAEGEGQGTVAVFASLDDLEGCSRRVPAGALERLNAFPHVDLCDWSRD